MPKCPICGYDPQKQYNYSLEIRKLMKEFSPSLRKQIRSIFVELNKGLSDEWKIATSKDMFELLMAIKNINEISIKRGIDIYVNSGALADRKGLRYLKAIINNLGRVSDIQIKNEIRKKGKAPVKLVKAPCK